VSDRDAATDGARPLVRTLLRRLPYVVIFATVVAAATFVGLSLAPPHYRATATLLIVPGAADPADGNHAAADSEIVASQVQRIRSPGLAGKVVATLRLADDPEFARGAQSWIGAAAAALGLSRPSEDSSGQKLLDAYYQALAVYQVDGSRVVAVDFSAEHPERAAEAANAVAGAYVAELRAAQEATGREAAALASAHILRLQTALAEAEAAVERHRAEHDGMGGGSTRSLSNAARSRLSADLADAQAARAAAETKAAALSAGIDAGDAVALAGVANSPLIQRLVERRSDVRMEIARLNATHLPQHPRMRELAAQLADANRQIGDEAARLLAAVEADAAAARARERELARAIASADSAAAEARQVAQDRAALEQELAAQRSLLAAALEEQRQAASQEQEYLPADARLVSAAAAPLEPAGPRPLLLALAAGTTAFVLALAVLVVRALGGSSDRPETFADASAVGCAAGQESENVTAWGRGEPARRRAHEPTLVPEMADRSGESLGAIAKEIARSGEKRILVTLAEGSEANGRPLGAVALARVLARADARVVLVDFHLDGANAMTMGATGDLPGFTDLFGGNATFAQVIFRDRKSRVHFIPAGRQPLSPARIDAEQLETILSALSLTYDYVLLDTDDEMLPVVARSCGVAVVVSEHDMADKRTIVARDRVRDVSIAEILLLSVDPFDEAEPRAGLTGAVAA
jgi:succinoglycan biosynthesis transport protein ExoP